ncbi:MAG: hypothetical protein U0793_03265 [Gemmataceae bacterium]
MAAEPDGPAADQVADDNAVGVASANGDLVDADGPRCRVAGAAELLGHVLLVEFLDRMPIEERLSATALMELSRQRRPTKKAKRLV